MLGRTTPANTECSFIFLWTSWKCYLSTFPCPWWHMQMHLGSSFMNGYTILTYFRVVSQCQVNVCVQRFTKFTAPLHHILLSPFHFRSRWSYLDTPWIPLQTRHPTPHYVNVSHASHQPHHCSGWKDTLHWQSQWEVLMPHWVSSPWKPVMTIWINTHKCTQMQLIYSCCDGNKGTCSSGHQSSPICHVQCSVLLSWECCPENAVLRMTDVGSIYLMEITEQGVNSSRWKHHNTHPHQLTSVRWRATKY